MNVATPPPAVCGLLRSNVRHDKTGFWYQLNFTKNLSESCAASVKCGSEELKPFA